MYHLSESLLRWVTAVDSAVNGLMIERELFINVKETPQAFLSTSTFSSFLFTSASFLFSSEIACGGEEKAREGEELERKRESKVSKASSVHHSLLSPLFCLSCLLSSHDDIIHLRNICMVI